MIDRDLFTFLGERYGEEEEQLTQDGTPEHDDRWRDLLNRQLLRSHYNEKMWAKDEGVHFLFADDVEIRELLRRDGYRYRTHPDYDESWLPKRAP